MVGKQIVEKHLSLKIWQFEAAQQKGDLLIKLSTAWHMNAANSSKARLHSPSVACLNNQYNQQGLKESVLDEW